MSYPVSDDGNCPYCHSSDVLYIVVVSNSNQKDAQECDQNSEKTHQSPSSTNLNDGRQQSYDSQADPSSDTLHQDDNQDENNAEEDKDTTATATQDKVETSPIGSDTDEQYPDIIKSLLKLGRAYKVPEDKGIDCVVSF